MFSAVGCWYGTCVEVEVLVVLVVSGRPQSADSRFCTEYGDDNTECTGFCCTLHHPNPKSKRNIGFHDSKAWRQYREPQAVE